MTKPEKNKYGKFVSQGIQIFRQSIFKRLRIELSKQVANNNIITQKSLYVMGEEGNIMKYLTTDL